MAAAEHAVRQGHQCAFGEKAQDLAEHTLRQFLVVSYQLIDVHAEVREIFSKWSKPDMRIGIEVSFAELDEPAESSKAIHRPDHGLASQRVEHDVHANALGECGNLVDEGERARIADEVGAEVAQQRSLVVATCSRNNARS